MLIIKNVLIHYSTINISSATLVLFASNEYQTPGGENQRSLILHIKINSICTFLDLYTLCFLKNVSDDF